MIQTIQAAWARYLTGREIDGVAFVDELLALGTSGHSLTGRALSPSEVVFTVGAESGVVTGDQVKGNFRSVCARLAVVFSPDPLNPVNLYGARARKRFEHAGREVELELEFENKPGESWFRILVPNDASSKSKS